MSNYKDAQRARKNAVERYRYYRRKRNILDKYSTIQNEVIPELMKYMDEDYYAFWETQYDSMTPSYFDEAINKIYYEPEDETAPFEVSLSEEYYDRLLNVNETIAKDFYNALDYVYDYTSLSEIDIEDLLSQCEEYISTIEGIYEGYVSNRPTATEQDQRNNMYWAATRTLHKMMKDVFHIELKEY